MGTVDWKLRQQQIELCIQSIALMFRKLDPFTNIENKYKLSKLSIKDAEEILVACCKDYIQDYAIIKNIDTKKAVKVFREELSELVQRHTKT